jgi:hypothetical protein
MAERASLGDGMQHCALNGSPSLAAEPVYAVSARWLWEFVPSLQLVFDKLLRLCRSVVMTKLLAAIIMPKHIDVPRTILPPARVGYRGPPCIV